MSHSFRSHSVHFCMVLCGLFVSTIVVGQSPTPKKSLYDRLGGKVAITAVVDSFVVYVAADERINAYFQETVLAGRIPSFKAKLVDQICQVTGGPCKYKGKNMKKAHKNMGVKTADFSALVEDLIKALDHFKVPAQEKAELLSILGPMQGDIVGH